jgi:hypothetical protein
MDEQELREPVTEQRDEQTSGGPEWEGYPLETLAVWLDSW